MADDWRNEDRRRGDLEWRQHAQSHMDHLSEEQRRITVTLEALHKRMDKIEEEFKSEMGM